jgi:hypothetical protein
MIQQLNSLAQYEIPDILNQSNSLMVEGMKAPTSTNKRQKKNLLNITMTPYKV